VLSVVFESVYRLRNSEHDIAKEQQHLVFRVAERTAALPLGRALLTFASVDTVTNDTYKVPELEFGIKVLPFNTLVHPDPAKVTPDSLTWAEFHNGVAAGLRIAPSARPIASSWITFNKPTELTPSHAGFLFALGLTGHLRSMLTWHTFTYLTPKHDLTSIGVLLGLSTANIGTGNKHVTKLLAVHTPALLPKSSVELNIPILTQAAGLSGVGLLYLGTGSRRMAEVTLSELGRQNSSFTPGSNNREAYCVSAALAFGMIMIGRGATATSAADLNFISRLHTLIHGDKQKEPAFDLNITSPSASIALGMMFLRTGKREIADTLEIPDNVTGLNRIPPNFLLFRVLGKSLIMWDSIKPTHEWIMGQLSPGIAKAMELRVKGDWVDSSFELAYYYIVSGSSLAMGLRYAGSANEDAYRSLIHFYDLFSRIAAIGKVTLIFHICTYLTGAQLEDMTTKSNEPLSRRVSSSYRYPSR
jgi:anaphase-promoting complex subunit 1